MAFYSQLLIEAGGGIIDHGKQSERQGDATLVIGLGGTGADAVIKLKKEVYKLLKPDDVNAVIPRYDAIRYLVIDSDPSKINEQTGKLADINKNTEFLSLCSNIIIPALLPKLRGKKEFYWLSDWLSHEIHDICHSCASIRQVGRLQLVEQAQALYVKIKEEMMSALRTSRTGTLNVHICAGLSGGTGSGTFLDVCYLVRKALAEIGKPEANVCGYFFLPDVNLSVPAISVDPLKSESIKINGYAALKELDYCMNFARNKDSFKMDYGFCKVDYNVKPVNLCYLISATDSSGNIVKNGYQYALGVVVDHIISFLARVQLPPGVNEEEDELFKHIAPMIDWNYSIPLQHGACVDYNILGASVAEMPFSEIVTYLGANFLKALMIFMIVFLQKRKEMSFW